MPKLDEQISTLQQKLELLKLRQQRVDGRNRALTALRQRKADTRCKIVLGGLMLEKLRSGAPEAGQIAAWLAAGLTRNAERALFDLPPMPATPMPAADHEGVASGRNASGETEALPGGEHDHGDGIG